MRILHTSDWHIGRTFHGHATLEALRDVLGALVAQVREHDVDVVLVAGDVFDSATPAAGCYPLLSDTLAAIRDAGAQIIVTSGNHDSAARLGFQSQFAAHAGIHVVTEPLSIGTPVTIADEHGPVHFYGVPYLEPSLVRHFWPHTELRTQAQTMAHAMTLVRDDLSDRKGRSVAMAHCFAASVDAIIESTPGVEREIRSGTLDVVPLEAFDGPDYVALGHIHGRAELSERVRYAGAPLHYSFAERDKPRGAWLVDLNARGLAAVEWLPLPIPRRLVTLRGTLRELLTDPVHDVHHDDWVCAVLTDSTPQLDPMRQLQKRFAWCATIQLDPQGLREVQTLTYAERRASATSDIDVIDGFLEHVREGEGASDAERELIGSVIAGARVFEAGV